MSNDTLLERLKTFDRQRASFPGEHWIVFGLGVALLVYASRRRSTLGRTIATAAGTSLVTRAASGRDGIARWWQR